MKFYYSYTVAMVLRISWIATFCLIFQFALKAQVTGQVLDVAGHPLPYATISYQEGNKGTTTNLQGKYAIKLDPGEYTLLYQYIGYKSESRTIVIEDTPQVINVTLQPEAIDIAEVTINANAEDPAYQIMRNAIAKRDYYKNIIETYKGDLYIKGLVEAVDVPKTFLGQEVGDLEGILDSNRQGIVYLSESKSTIYYRHPGEFKEVMVSSKTAGDDSGLTFNQYGTVNFNFYYENIQFDRTMISPLHDESFNHYLFKLEGVLIDEKGRIINKIKVIPKDDVKPLFSGMIYIFEDQWNIHSLDLQFTGKAIKNDFFDYVRIRQLMQESEETGIWYTQNQIIDFKAGFFTFKFGGTFSYFFNDIAINTPLSDNIFGAELFSMEDNAMERTKAYWDSIRPLPLTKVEQQDYLKRDSLTALRESKGYLDSIDRKNNRFIWTNLIFGHDHSNTYENRYLKIGSPLALTRFNAVEGFALGTKVILRDYDDENNRRIWLTNQFRYGFSDKQMKWKMNGSYRLSRIDLTFFTFGMGREYFQFDERKAITTRTNTFSSLLYKRNHIKLFDKRFLQLGYQTEISNGWYAWVKGHYENRRPLQMTTNYSIFRKDWQYPSNLPVVAGDEYVFEEHDAYLIDFNLRWRPGQKFFDYGKFKARIVSDWPTVQFYYRKAIPLSDGGLSYDRIRLRIYDNNIGMNTLGFGTINLEGGTFITQDRVELMDNFHFLGNQTVFTYYDLYNRGFKMMPFYRFSTTSDYGMLIYEHHFDGYIADQIPLIRDTNMTFVFGMGGMIKSGEDYYELSIGLEHIGIGVLELFRVDLVTAYTGSDFLGTSVKIGVSRFLDEIID